MSNHLKSGYDNLLDVSTEGLAALIIEGQTLQHKLTEEERVIREDISLTNSSLSRHLRRIHRQSAKQSQYDLAIKLILAKRFGALHGWRYTTKLFGLDDLIGRKVRRRCYTQPIDHPYYYRELDKPYRAAAIAGHEYNWPHNRTLHQKGFDAEIITDFPSWHYPEHCSLILITPTDINGDI
jgi:hypothetical protein